MVATVVAAVVLDPGRLVLPASPCGLALDSLWTAQGFVSVSTQILQASSMVLPDGRGFTETLARWALSKARAEMRAWGCGGGP